MKIKNTCSADIWHDTNISPQKNTKASTHMMSNVYTTGMQSQYKNHVEGMQNPKFVKTGAILFLDK